MTRQESKKIVRELHDKYYGKKSAKNKGAKKDVENGRITEAMAPVLTKKSRNDLMIEAKTKGIKNFRVLNKAELGLILVDGVTQDQIDKVVSGAVARWKSGWGSKKDKA